MIDLQCARRAGDWRCTNNAEPGLTQCRKHASTLKQTKRRQKAEQDAVPETIVMRPAWMDNPALLPKRPPGR